MCVSGWALAQSEPVRAANAASIQTSIGIITNLSPGLSLEEVQKRLAAKLQHEFTAGIESNQFLCVLMRNTQSSAPAFFYLLFRNGGLSGILEEPQPVFERKTYRGKPASVPKPVDPEEELGAVLKQPFLRAAEIKQRMEAWAAAAEAASSGKEPGNIRPAFALAAPLVAAKAPTVAKARKEAASLIEKYDPFKIKIGMSPAEVQSLFGLPNNSERKADQVLEVYGARLPPAATLPVASSEPPPTEVGSVFVAVVFQNGKVTRVFSHDFFDKRTLKQL